MTALEGCVASFFLAVRFGLLVGKLTSGELLIVTSQGYLGERSPNPRRKVSLEVFSRVIDLFSLKAILASMGAPPVGSFA